MQRTLNKYRLGLGVIGLFTFVILILVVVQASATRQDQQTENTANDIATKLNTYVSYSASGAAPYSLSQAGIGSIPDTISYTRTSAYSYQFCVTYKHASTGFSASGVEQNIIMRGFGSGAGAGGGGTGQNSYNNLPDLEIDPIHHKGVNCQTVTLYNYNSNTTTPLYNSQ